MSRWRAAVWIACLVLPLPCAAAGSLQVRIAGVAPADGATTLSYVLTNRTAQPFALVRVNCTLRDPSGATVDQASDVTENLGARQAVEGQAYFNTGAVSSGTRFACRVDQAYR